MDFKKLYDALAQKAAHENEKLPFIEGDPRKFGHGAPDPDWALMAIHAGQQEGILSSEQAQRMRKNFAPHARFEHAENGDVHVRTHTRNGKTIAAHTRSAPQSTQAITPPSRAVKRCYLLTICQHKILQPISRIAPSL